MGAQAADGAVKRASKLDDRAAKATALVTDTLAHLIEKNFVASDLSLARIKVLIDWKKGTVPAPWNLSTKAAGLTLWASLKPSETMIKHEHEDMLRKAAAAAAAALVHNEEDDEVDDEEEDTQY